MKAALIFLFTDDTKYSLYVAASEKSWVDWDYFGYGNKLWFKNPDTWMKYELRNTAVSSLRIPVWDEPLAEEWAREIVPGFSSCITSQ